MKKVNPVYVVLMAFSIVVLLLGKAQAGHSGTKVENRDLMVGSGAQAGRHSRVSVLYSEWLADGSKFNSSLDRDQPFAFTLGGGRVIRGWDMGVAGMKAGGKRELIAPPELAYGKQGSGPIPPDATLRFEVELLSVAPPQYSNIDNNTLKIMVETGVKIVDLRRQDEWDSTGIIAGSELMTAFDGSGRFVKDFPAKFQALVGSDEKVILICRSGNRSSTIANMLVEGGGFTKIYNLTNGIAKWIGDGNPVVKR